MFLASPCIIFIHIDWEISSGNFEEILLMEHPMPGTFPFRILQRQLGDRAPPADNAPQGPRLKAVIVCGGRVKRGNGGENSWSSSSRVCSWSTAGQEFPLAFGVPFPPSLCSFLQAVDKFPPYKSFQGLIQRSPWGGNQRLERERARP